jgi:quercetin dioxygenase-like cupin family protein
MEIVRGRPDGAGSGRAEKTFVGEVWKDPVLSAAEGVVVNTITFTPGSRTFWHQHERGQLLQVVAGTGLVCVRGEQPQLLHVGDTVWVPPLETHWHGGTADTLLIHVAISLGRTTWFEEVADRHPALADLAGR